MPGFFVPLGFWVEEGREVGEHCSYFSFPQKSLKVRVQGERSVEIDVLEKLRGIMRREWLLPSKRILEALALQVFS